ncbi:hypothetical protein H4R19_006140, partial [Coemansia spiralis]
QRWTAADRLQHHRGAAQPMRLAVVAAAGIKRRRSDEPGRATDDGQSPPVPTRNAHSQPVSASGSEQRRQIAGVRGAAGRVSSNAAVRTAGGAGRAAGGAQQTGNTTGSEIMERVLRIEKQLSSKQLDADVVLDLFTPATKLKTSRGWLKHARELEQKGDLEKAMVHYEEALRYAPELNKLEAHIAKLRAKIRRQKRRSSIASHGSANVKVAPKPAAAPAAAMLVPCASESDEDEDEDVGHLWMRDGLAESPSADKAKRSKHRVPTTAHVRPMSNGAGVAKLAANGAGRADGAGCAKAVPNGSAMAVPNGSAMARPAVSGARPADKLPTKRRRVLSSDGQRVAAVTAGSVHDRRISFGGSQLNPFVVGGSEFDSELQRQLDQRTTAARGPLHTRKLVAKSAAAARLQQALAEPPTPGDRTDKDFIPQSDSGSDADPADLVRAKKPGRRVRLPGALGVRGLVEQRLAAAAGAEPPKPRHVSAGDEEPLQTDAFNEITIASALQMINSAEVKKIMKLQGI